MERGDCRRRLSLHERIAEVVIIPHAQVSDPHGGATAGGVDLHAVLVNAGDPEQAAVGDAGVEIMNLLSKLLSKNVQSYQRKRAVVQPAVQPDEGALHKAQVHLEGQVAYRAGRQIGVGTHPPDVGETDLTNEVSDD